MQVTWAEASVKLAQISIEFPENMENLISITDYQKAESTYRILNLLPGIDLVHGYQRWAFWKKSLPKSNKKLWW